MGMHGEGGVGGGGGGHMPYWNERGQKKKVIDRIAGGGGGNVDFHPFHTIAPFDGLVLLHVIPDFISGAPTPFILPSSSVPVPTSRHWQDWLLSM